MDSTTVLIFRVPMIVGTGGLRKGNFRIRNLRYARTEVQVAERVNQYGAKGDSGGPAFVVQGAHFYLFGVANWGDNRPNIEIFANINAHRAWIVQATARLRANNP